MSPIDREKQTSNVLDYISVMIGDNHHFGIRQLLVLSGQDKWIDAQVELIRKVHQGEWIRLGSSLEIFPESHPTSKSSLLLGREFLHAIFDVRHAFHAESFAILAGTLKAGSLLLILLPEWQKWSDDPDHDTLRWMGTEQAVATPRFTEWFQKTLLQEKCAIWCENREFVPASYGLPTTPWLHLNQEATVEQQTIIKTLYFADKGCHVLMAERGRGKSAVMGMFASTLDDESVLVTALAQTSVKELLRWSQGNAKFIAPDRLIEWISTERAETLQEKWLIIDEAAALPISMLKQLTTYFPKTVLATTVSGYEGTGRGFLLKFCTEWGEWKPLLLTEPIRFAKDDPLEAFVNRSLLLDVEATCILETDFIDYHIHQITQQQLLQQPMLLEQLYALLTSSHYRTSPRDLRRLLDAENLSLLIACNEKQELIGAVWLTREGGLSEALAHGVWCGTRRPKGSLVAQSLSAHAGYYQAPRLHSWRICRIAVLPQCRRRGVAKRLIETFVENCKQQENGVDYLSVSFGYTEALEAFWQTCHLQQIHLSYQQEASSGSFSSMAIMPLSEKGVQFYQQSRAAFYRRNQNLKRSPHELSQHEWKLLAGASFASRPFESITPLLETLEASLPDLPLPTLRAYIYQQQTVQSVAKLLKLSGKHSVIQQCRSELQILLYHWDAERSETLQKWIKHPFCDER